MNVLQAMYNKFNTNYHLMKKGGDRFIGPSTIWYKLPRYDIARTNETPRNLYCRENIVAMQLF